MNMPSFKAFALYLITLLFILFYLPAQATANRLPNITHVTQQASDSLLLDAASFGNIEGLKKLLQQGANINTRGLYNETPLMAAVTSGQIETVYFLLTHNANTALTNYQGMTALHLASENSYPDILNLLLQFNADINAKNAQGYSPLLIAALLGHDEIITLLINHHADTTCQDNKQNNALMLSILTHQTKVIETLVSLTGEQLFHQKNLYNLSPLKYSKTLNDSQTYQAIQRGLKQFHSNKKSS